MLRVLTACCLSILIAAPAARADQTCTGPSAFLQGSSNMSAGGATLVYTQTLALHYDGETPPYGRWVGVEHVQSNWNSLAMAPQVQSAVAAAPTVTLPGVDASCETDVPDAHTITVTCVGEYPFTVHEDGAITWEGQSLQIGTYFPASASGPAGMNLDLLIGAPGYSSAPGVINGFMAGDVEGVGPYRIEALIRDRVTGQTGGSAYSEMEITLVPRPQTVERVDLSAIASSSLATITVLDRDSVLVRLYGQTSAARMDVAQLVDLTGRLAHPRCPVTTTWRLGELLLIQGVQP